MIDEQGRHVKWVRDGMQRRTTAPIPQGEDWFMRTLPNSCFALCVRLEGDTVAETRTLVYETVSA